jgi:hypothetical protein
MTRSNLAKQTTHGTRMKRKTSLFSAVGHNNPIYS